MTSPEDSEIITPRRHFLGMIGLIGATGAYGAWYANSWGNDISEFRETAGEDVEEAYDKILEMETDKFETGSNDIDLRINGAKEEITLELVPEIPVDTDYDDDLGSKDIAGFLSQPDYLEEGGEIFDTFASSVLNIEDLSGLNILYNGGVGNGNVFYQTDVEEIRDSSESLEEFYRRDAAEYLSENYDLD